LCLRDRSKRVFKKLAFIFVAFLLGVFSTGCRDNLASPNLNAQVASIRSSNLATFRMSLCSAPATLDPALAVSESELFLTECIYNTLVEKGDGAITAELAESWSYSDDGKILTIKLKKGVKFHNGAPLTAADVEFSLERITDPLLGSPYVEMIRTKTGMDHGQFQEAVNQEGPYTLSIKFNEPNPGFIELLASPGFSIVNREVVGENAPYGKPGDYFTPVKPVIGSGPFELVEWVDRELLTLQANPSYFGGTTVLERIEFVIYDDLSTAIYDFRAENLDVVSLETANLPRILKEYPELEEKIQCHLSDTVYLLGFNLNKKPLDQLQVRQALVMALDISRIVRSTNSATQPFQKAGTEVEYNSEAAKKLLEQLGYNAGEKKFPQIALGFSPGPVEQVIAKNIKAQLAEINVNVELKEFTGTQGERNIGDLFIVKRADSAVAIFGCGLPGGTGKPDKRVEAEILSMVPLVQEYNFYGVHDWVKLSVDRSSGMIDLMKTRLSIKE